MPPSPSTSGSVRSAAAVNEDIRALLARTGGWLYGGTRKRYEALVTEWTLAVAAERLRENVVEAA